MQHKQFNFARQRVRIVVLALPLVMGWPALAGFIVQPSKPDPLLDGGPTDPCAAGVDYAQGLDANGQPVVPADVEARPVPVPDAIAIPLAGRRPPVAGSQGKGLANQSASRSDRGMGGPTAGNPVTLGGDSTYISLDGKKLEPLLNPAPCASVH